MYRSRRMRNPRTAIIDTSSTTPAKTAEAEEENGPARRRLGRFAILFRALTPACRFPALALAARNRIVLSRRIGNGAFLRPDYYTARPRLFGSSLTKAIGAALAPTPRRSADSSSENVVALAHREMGKTATCMRTRMRHHDAVGFGSRRRHKRQCADSAHTRGRPRSEYGRSPARRDRSREGACRPA